MKIFCFLYNILEVYSVSSESENVDTETGIFSADQQHSRMARSESSVNSQETYPLSCSYLSHPNENLTNELLFSSACEQFSRNSLGTPQEGYRFNFNRENMLRELVFNFFIYFENYKMFISDMKKKLHENFKTSEIISVEIQEGIIRESYLTPDKKRELLQILQDLKNGVNQMKLEHERRKNLDLLIQKQLENMIIQLKHIRRINEGLKKEIELQEPRVDELKTVLEGMFL